MNPRIKKSICLVFLSWVCFGAVQAAQVDLGFTLGEVKGASGILSGTAVRLGTFTGYDDTQITTFFSGKDYTTLSGLFNSFTNVDNPQILGTDSAGQYYGSFDTGSTGAGVRLFAWFYNTSTPSGSAKWAIVSGGGTGANENTFNPYWLSVASTAVDVNVIEAATIYSKIYASSGMDVKLLSTTVADPEGAYLLIPEPSSVGLIFVGLASLLFARTRKKTAIHGQDCSGF